MGGFAGHGHVSPAGVEGFKQPTAGPEQYLASAPLQSREGSWGICFATLC
jgi:hypothetical protein